MEWYTAEAPESLVFLWVFLWTAPHSAVLVHVTSSERINLTFSVGIS